MNDVVRHRISGIFRLLYSLEDRLGYKFFRRNVHMQRWLKIVYILIGVMVILGCDKGTEFRARPVGYGLVATDFVAQGSFLFDSRQPYNVNEVSLTLYHLPHHWGEITASQAALVALDDPNFIVWDTVQGEQTIRRAFVKHVLIFNDVWTCVREGDAVVYRDADGVDIRVVLQEEEAAKNYIDGLESLQIYYITSERTMLLNYESKYQGTGVPFRAEETDVIMINYAEELEAFPDLSSHFTAYDADLIAILFQRVYDQRLNPEFKIFEYTK
jgi:hypothetical protein